MAGPGRTIRAPRGALYLWALLGVLLTAQARADYDADVAQALKAYAERRFETALAAFQRAHDQEPSARTHRGIGISAVQLGRFVLARQHLKLALQSQDRPLGEKLRTRTREALALAEAPLSRFALRHAAGAAITVDGEPAVRDDATGELLLDPGEHVVVATATDGAEVTRTVQAARAQRGELDLLPPQPAPSDPPPPLAPPVAEPKPPFAAPAASAASGEPAAPAAPPPATTPRTTAPRHWPVGPLVLVGAGVATLVAAGVTGALALGHKRALDSGCDGRTDCDPELSSRPADGETMRDATNLLLGVGGAAVLGGGLWWTLQWRGEQASARLAPRVGAGYVGLAVEGAL